MQRCLELLLSFRVRDLLLDDLLRDEVAAPFRVGCRDGCKDGCRHRPGGSAWMALWGPKGCELDKPTLGTLDLALHLGSAARHTS